MKWLLRRLVGADFADSILGDLEEQAHRRAPRSPISRTRWLYLQVAVVIAHALAHRAREGADEIRHAGIFGISKDIRYAFRALRRTPWYAATVITVVALSMALAATVFAVVDGVLLRGLPYPRVDQVVAIEGGWTSRPQLLGNVPASPSDAVAWAAATPEVLFTSFTLGGREQIDDGQPARSADVASNFFDVIGQTPMIGGFRPQHFVSRTAIRPALLTYYCWQRRFGADRTVIGRVVRGDRGAAIEIVGVLPEEFLFPSSLGRFVPEVITPLITSAGAATDRGRRWYVLARLPASMTVEALQARLHVATDGIARQFPKGPGGQGPGPFDVVRVRPIDVALRSASRQTFLLIFITAAVLLLVACLNVMGLAAARAQDRRQELALRRAIGATGTDLVRLLAAESLVTVILGGALGLSASWILVGVVSSFLPESISLLKPLTVDWRVGAFVAAASAVCLMLTTAWPARAVLRSNSAPGLVDAGRVTGRQRTVGRLGLVAAQVALALLMSLGGVLVAKSLVRVWREDPGYRVSQTTNIWLSSRADESRAHIADLLDDLGGLPDVGAAGGSNLLLLQRAVRGSSFDAPAGVVETSNIESVGVTRGYFEATGIRPLVGRLPTEDELDGAAPVVLVSDRVARDYWPGRSAVGQTLTRRQQRFDVIGVVPDARYLALDIDPDGSLYYPLFADPSPSLVNVFIAHNAGGFRSLSSVLNLIATRHPIYRVRSARDVGATLGDSIRQRSFLTFLFAGFGGAAVVIAAVGVLGLAAIVTSRRTREVGVRMAVGARPAQIVGLVVRQELAGVLCGLTAGALAAAWSVRLMQPYMYKVSVYDPVAWTAAIGLLLATSTIGVLIPALRASRTDPVKALRAE